VFGLRKNRFEITKKKLAVGASSVIAIAGGFLAMWFGAGSSPTSALDLPLTNATYVREVSAGGDHTCAIFNADGLLYCWGKNDKGQLGIGSTVDKTTPTSVMSNLPAGAKVKQVSAGFQHTCAVVSVAGNDQIYCWGKNDNGQLGNGITLPVAVVDSQNKNIPAVVANPGGLTPKKVSAGFAHTCTIYTSGSTDSVYCWGNNDEGQLGDGTGTFSTSASPPNWTTKPTSRSAPYLVSGLFGAVTDIAAGATHTCLVAGGQSYCFGGNGSYQYGNNSINSASTPTATTSSSGASLNTAGFFYSCTIINGAASCWGDNTSGQIGNNSTTIRTTPYTVAGNLSAKTVKQIGGGYAHVCAVAGNSANTTADALWCWGDDTSGQVLNSGTAYTNKLVPTAVTLNNANGVNNAFADLIIQGADIIAKKVSGGFAHTCAIYGVPGNETYNVLFCGGLNNDGQLGNGSTVTSPVLIKVDTSSLPNNPQFISVANDGDINMNIDPSPSAMASAVGNVTVTANSTGGYGLFVSVVSPTENSLVNLSDGSYKVAAVSATNILAPSALGANNWGFAVPGGTPGLVTNGFDASYTTPTLTSKFLAVPISSAAQQVVSKSTGSLVSGDNYNFYYAARVNTDIMAGMYQNTVVYTAIAEPEPIPPEVFKFTIDTRMTDTLFADGDTPATNPAHFAGTATVFAIPTSGRVNNVNHPYSWVINCGDGTPDKLVSGTSSTSANPGMIGILCDYGPTGSNTGPGEYQITIKSNGPATPGWMNAFGFFDTTAGTGSNDPANRIMFKSIDTPFTDNMRTPGSTYRFLFMFFGARNGVGIPANLFSKINTSGATDMSWMFSRTFWNYAYNSTTATIPAGLFDSINTNSATNLSAMFHATFYFYAYNSTLGTIPAGLFNSINTSSATIINDMFRAAFNNYAFANKLGGTPDTDINTIWGSANLSGITAANAGDTNGALYNTFYNMPSLTGSAQTFIDTKLSHWSVPRVPAVRAQTFLNTGVTDLASLNANWK